METHIKRIYGKWYAFATAGNDVYSIGADNPKQPGCLWMARATDTGIQYVATPSPNRNAALKKANRNGTYGGAW